MTRTVLALVSVLMVGWSVLVWRDDRVGYDAANRIFKDPGMSEAQWKRALGQLRDADLLNPGTDWEVSRASALLLRDKREAQRVASSVVSREPDNLGAWVVVLRATRGRDQRTAARALAEIRRLNPLPHAR